MNMLELIPNKIDLWLAFTNEMLDLRLLDQYRKLLSDKEQVQEHRYHFSKDQHRYLVTRALVRNVLSRYAPVAPKDWTFLTNKHGKPEIMTQGKIAKTISFNISHTQDLIVLGVTKNNPLGIDVENIYTKRSLTWMASKFLSEEEFTDLHTCSASKQRGLFFQYWTLKESYIKARGMGLSIPLRKCCFNLHHNDSSKITFNSPMDDRSSRWHFWQLQVNSEYLVAICVGISKNPIQQLNILKFAPFSEEFFCDFTVLRESL